LQSKVRSVYNQAMGKVKFKLYYPEFSNILLSIYALSEIDSQFGHNFRKYYKHRKGNLSEKDQEYLELFKNEIRLLTLDYQYLNKFLSIIFDQKVDNLILLKRKIEKDFKSFDCTNIDKVYLYFYSRLLGDYKLFQTPILASLSRLEKQLEDQRVIYHLEKFHKFLEQEKLMKVDSHFFVVCNYFGEGAKAQFIRFSEKTILLYLPILINEKGNICFNFNEKAFLEQIFYHALSLQFEEKQDKFTSIIEEHNISRIHFQGAMVGALHYGIYAFDIYRETLNLVKVTDYLEKKLLESHLDKDQVSFAIKLAPLIERFYKDRKSLDKEFLDEVVYIHQDLQKTSFSQKNIIEGVKNKEEEVKKGLIFSA